MKNSQEFRSIKNTKGGEEVPAGGWRGGEEIPKGGWRGGEEVPAGGWRGGGEEIPTGGWRTYAHKDTYRTNDGRAYFTFGFAQVGSKVEIDILDSPSYGTRSSGLHPTHRLPSARGGYMVCFAEPSISNSLSSARNWASKWAEHTWKYILSGTSFPGS